ncbi:putative DNA modification/repair radical SAM protein [Aminithiophilus ramosus]|uniref:DNA modification/repair radical SAM protein n=1 Tax=Aminithiophilus ramosus TaxID=3029084 RepID=A0A9Q7AMP3_9BACT|nr:putative DNA modification/repair radical SAM protein [Aminithiophilus ramosus]QTX32188.1 putative DNA modification/repair radical SAM protein [Aminithiophilus ramosus]
MDGERKLAVLGEAARHDVSCSSSGSARRGAFPGGICHSWTADGRCVSLLKVLLSNRCRYDCAYCANRASADVERTEFAPAELAELTVAFHRRNYIEGLFLSSAVVVSPDATMERIVATLRLLRTVHRFRGYIHAKVIPGADRDLVRLAALYADRVSVNIELPSEASLLRLAPQKSGPSILGPMATLATTLAEGAEARRRSPKAPPVAVGQSTQLIVGASPETDRTILTLTQALYRKFHLSRVYYSAYVPVGSSPFLPGPEKAPPLRREHRLYQADWLLRLYGFDVDELVDEGSPLLDDDLDPKARWALNHLERFPLEVNDADYSQLLRVPGLGRTTARRIVEARRTRRLDADALPRLGLALKRARHFLTCDGRFLGDGPLDAARLRRRLSDGPDGESRQLRLFP